MVTADASLPLPSNPSWYAHAYGEAYEYPNRELDLLYGEENTTETLDQWLTSQIKRGCTLESMIITMLEGYRYQLHNTM